MRYGTATLTRHSVVFRLACKIAYWEVDVRWADGTLDQNHKVLAAIHIFRCRKAHSHTLPPNVRALPQFEANDGGASLYESLDSLRNYLIISNVFIYIVLGPNIRRWLSLWMLIQCGTDDFHLVPHIRVYSYTRF